MIPRLWLLAAALLLLPLFSQAAENGSGYEAQLRGWSSYHDVANWLRDNFVFDRGRLFSILERTRQTGPAGLLARSPAATYEAKKGYCTDAANFAIQALNKIKPEHQARYVFIKNRFGQPHHWVAGFMENGRIMILDYGAGPEWSAMKGIHGPYDSLEEYAAFLRSLGISKFAPESVEWRPVFPGQED